MGPHAAQGAATKRWQLAVSFHALRMHNVFMGGGSFMIAPPLTIDPTIVGKLKAPSRQQLNMASQAEPSPGKWLTDDICSQPKEPKLTLGIIEARQQNFEQSVAFSLHLWPVLSLAVQNNWSDNSGDDVRDWFAGAVVELFPSLVDVAAFSARLAQNKGLARPENLEEPDMEDVEGRLLQVMEDEFNVNVDDDSSYEIAEQIIRLRAQCINGDFTEVDKLREKWASGRGKKVVMKQAPDQDQDTDWEEEDDEDDEDEDEDVDMNDAPAAPKEKPQPEVDDDGFTKVAHKKR